MTAHSTGQADHQKRYGKPCGDPCPRYGNPLICWRSECDNPLVCQRSTRLYCSNACRQSVYRRRRKPKVWHRRPARSRIAPVVRETVCLAAAAVRPISLPEARRVIEQREPMCAVGTLAYGLFLGSSDQPASVVVFGVHPASNLSPRHDQTIALLRGHTEKWAPRNCASKLIKRAMRLLPERYTTVIAFLDATVGENGTIYRGAGFQPIGASVGGRRVKVHFQGRVLSDRAARREFGTSSAPKLAALGLKVETFPRRERWIAHRQLVTCANPECGIAFQPQHRARFCGHACRQAMYHFVPAPIVNPPKDDQL